MPRGKPPFIQFYTDAETQAYEAALKWRAAAAMRSRPPFEGPLAVRIFAMMPIPPSWPKRDRDAALVGTKLAVGKSDPDNISKIVLDSLNKTVWNDDSQIVRLLILKEFGEKPGVIVEVYRLP